MRYRTEPDETDPAWQVLCELDSRGYYHADRDRPDAGTVADRMTDVLARRITEVVR